MKTYERAAYLVTDHEGIHARPAGLLVKKATEFQSKVTIRKGEKEADMKRLFAVMSLGVKCGEKITVICEGVDEADASGQLNADIHTV